MIVSFLLWNDQDKQDIDWLAIDRVIVDRLRQGYQGAGNLVTFGNPSMGNGDTLAQTRRTELLSAQQGMINIFRVEFTVLFGQ